MPDLISLDDLTETPHENVFPGSEPKTVRLELEAGEEIPAHDHPERQIVLYLVSGALDVTLDGETHALESGDVLRFDGRRTVAPAARADSTALLVLAPRADDADNTDEE